MDNTTTFFGRISHFFHTAFQRRRRYTKILGKIIIYALLITISYVFIFPFFSMLSLSLMSQSDLINVEIDYIPTRLYFGNFAVALQVMDGIRALFNSIWFSAVLAISQTIISALTGYAFARYSFRFKGMLFTLILISFIVPVPIIFIPRFMMFIGFQSATGIKMIGTVLPQLLMSLLGQGVNSAILILIFYNFFRLIPDVLYEAARIDGATPFKQFWEITIKMSLSTIVVVFLFSFVWNWNETYVTQQLVGDNMILLPSQLGIFDTLFENRASGGQGPDGEARINEAYRMAATILSMIPLFIIYFVAQRQFVEGIEQTGITGE
jgi:multiple sugar transport system permease protein